MGWEYQEIFPGILTGFRPENQVAVGPCAVKLGCGLGEGRSEDFFM